MSEKPAVPPPEQPDAWPSRAWKTIAGAARGVRAAVTRTLEWVERTGLPEGLTLEEAREIARLWDDDCIEIARHHGGLGWDTRDAQMRSLESILQMFYPHLMRDELHARRVRIYFHNKRLPQAC